MENFHIQEATVSDAQGILEVHKTTWLCTYPNRKHNITLKDIQEKVDTFRVKRWEKNILDKEKNRTNIWVARDRDRVVGFGGASKGNKRNKLNAIYVDSDYHRKGIGTALIQKIFDFLGEEKPIVVEVVSYNGPAINFYKKHGFVHNREFISKHAALPSGKIMPSTEMIRKRKI